MEKYVDKKTGKVVLQIDDEGNETVDIKHFKDLAEKKKLEDEEDKEEDAKED